MGPNQQRDHISSTAKKDSGFGKNGDDQKGLASFDSSDKARGVENNHKTPGMGLILPLPHVLF